MAARLTEEQRAERDAALLAKIRQVPGLTTWALSRAILRTQYPAAKYIERSLGRLEAAGLVRCVRERFPCRAGYCTRWYPA